MPSRIQEDDDDAGALRPSFSLPRSENTSTTEESDDSSFSSTDPISARPKTKKSTEGDVLHHDHEYLFSFDGSSVLRNSHDSKIKGKKKKKNVRSDDKRSVKAGRSATTTYNTAQNEKEVKKTAKPKLLRPTDPKSDVDNSKVASLTPSPLPLTSMPKKKSNIEDTLEAMFREKNDKLDTLVAMFAAPWNRELLDAVLQHEKGHMQITCDRILNHGVQDPRLLLEQLKASGGGPEESQVVQELVPQKHDVIEDRNPTGSENDDHSDATKKTINSIKSNGIICNKVKNIFPDPGRKRTATSNMGARQLIAITDEEGGEPLQMVATTIQQQQQQQHPHISPWECTGMWAGLPARTMDGKDQDGLRDAETGDCSAAIDDEVNESFYEMGDRFSSMHGKAPTYTFDDQPPSLGVGRGGSIDSSHIFIDSGEEEEDQDQYSGIWSYPATSVAPGQIRSTSSSSSSSDIESQQEVASELKGLEEEAEEEDLVSEEREPRRSRKVLIGSPSILCELPNTSSSITSSSSSSANTDESFVYNKEERALPPPKEDRTRAKLATTTTPKKKKTKEDRFEDEEEQALVTPKTSRTSSSSSSPVPSPSSSSGHTIVIENKSKGGSGGGSFIKKLTCIIILGLLCTLGYFIYKWLSIPELEEQIQKLESEVNRLTGQVDRLEEENDRYATLNDELNNTVKDLHIIKDDLNTTTNRLSVINDELNATNQEFQIRIDELTLQNQQYQDLNDELNNTVAELGLHINEFQGEIATLIIQNAQLGNYTNELESIVGNLEDIANEQNITLQALHVGFGILTEQNNRLEELNDELELIVGFLNETSLGIDESLEDVTDFLAEQITTSRLLLLTNIETSYQSKISNWDCDYRDVYREKPFGTDFNLIIPPKEISNLIEYVDNRILSDLCLSRTNFQNYLTIQYGDDNLTSNRLVAGVSNYVSAALDWYFDNNSNNISNDSNGSENINENVGISQEEWAAAGYQCENLEVSFLFPIRTPFKFWD